jgi:elongation factor P--(R)-beta-lysine ligase
MGREEASRLDRIRPMLECRAKIVQGIRAFFLQRDFLEVDTPVRTPEIAPEQFILPYSCEGWSLSTSPELLMKRLLAAGYERIFQIAHCFRKEEKGRYHNPEFTLLEWYRAREDYRRIINDTEELVRELAASRGQGECLEYQGKKIDLSLPWPRLSVKDAYLKWAGWDPLANFDSLRFDLDMGGKVIPRFPAGRPTVILDYPPECAALARLKSGPMPAAERVEIFIGGLEIANGFSELTDPAEQEKRFRLEIEQIRAQGRAAELPVKFLESLGDLPPCAGMALGVDRLVMLLCDAGDIGEVLAFPADAL